MNHDVTPVNNSTACTLLLVTYNRPALLRQQITYLSQGLLPGPVLILDSSDEAAALQNADLASEQPGFDYLHYASTTPVFTKFAEGLAKVNTPYCMLLPDDDFLRLKALPALIDALEQDDEVVAAHGLYFEFHTNGRIVNVTQVIQRGADLIEDEASQRILSLMCGYEALTYALYRTPVAQEAFSLAAQQDSILAQELLAGTAAAARGKVRRLPIISHGRRAGSSLGYRRWHPLEWSAVNPGELFASYLPYRLALLNIVAQVENADIKSIERRLDLAHLAYLQKYLDGNVLRSIAAMDPVTDGEDAISEVAWDVWAGNRGPAWIGHIRRGGKITRWMRRQFRSRNIRQKLSVLRTRDVETVKITNDPNGDTINQICYHNKFAKALEALDNTNHFLAIQESLSQDLSIRESNCN